jgi:YVTN family beta-propeller protein
LPERCRKRYCKVGGWALAVDIGAASVTAAVRHRHEAEIVRFAGSESMAPAVFLDADLGLLAGSAAAERAARAPDHAVVSPRRSLTAGLTVMVAGSEVSLARVYAAVLARVAEEAARGQELPTPGKLVLTYPAAWGGSRLAALREAASLAGLPTPDLVLETVAAAGYLAATMRPGRHVAILRVGADSADAAALVRHPDGFRLIGEPGTVTRRAEDEPAAAMRRAAREMLAVLTDAGLVPGQLHGIHVTGEDPGTPDYATVIREIVGVSPLVSPSPVTDAVRGALTAPRAPGRLSRRKLTAAATAAAVVLAATAALVVHSAVGGSHPAGVIMYVLYPSDNLFGTPGEVLPVNTATNALGPPITVGIDPESIAAAPDGTTVYVANRGSDTVTPINTATDTAGPPIAVGCSPQSIVITPDGESAYVACSNGAVVLIKTKTSAVTTLITHQPGWIYLPLIAISPDGKSAYIASADSSTLTPVSTATNALGPPIPLIHGIDPQNVTVTPNGKTVYVTDFARSTVTPVSIASHKAGAPLYLPGQPTGLVITADGKTAYVSCEESAIVTPIDTATGTTRAPIPTGAPSIGMAITPDGKTAYDFHVSTSIVTPINTATDTVGTPIRLGGIPGAIAFMPDGATAYVGVTAPGKVAAPQFGTPYKPQPILTYLTSINTRTGATGRLIRVPIYLTRGPASAVITPVPKVPPVFPPAPGSAAPGAATVHSTPPKSP